MSLTGWCAKCGEYDKVEHCARHGEQAAEERGARRERMRTRRLLGPLISKMHRLILDGGDYQEMDNLKHDIYLVAWPPRKRKETGK